MTPRYAIPDPGTEPLTLPPALASWDAAGSPGQTRLARYLEAAWPSIEARAADLPDPLALRLDVGLAEESPLRDHHDLDNYLTPLAAYFGRRTKRPLASVWATKVRSVDSYLSLGPARETTDEALGEVHVVRTTASSSTPAFKQQIFNSLRAATPLGAGPVWLELAFTVGPTRNWINLWKPAIDALGPLLGNDNSGRPWHPQDGRVVRLGLHCSVDPMLRNHTLIAITASVPQPS